MEIIFKKLPLVIFIAISLYMIISFFLGRIAPEDFVNSQLPPEKLNFKHWEVYGHQEWAQLSVYLFRNKKTQQAEYAAKKAFSVNPGHGIAAVLLSDIYAKNYRFMEVGHMFDLSAKLWPARHYYLFEKANH